MAQQVSSKLLILFGLVCSIFFFAESSFAAVANKSSTFSAQLANQEDSDSQDSSFAEQIRAQRAAIDARENRDNIASKTKSGATKNSCDNDLRKCIESKCGDNYKKCETDSDTTFSDKLNSCKKNTGCTAHEFSVFVNEIKEDKKQAIRLAQYNQVLDCGNRYNDCIITECGQKFDKCLGKSAGDKAIAKCKSIATECTEADSGLTARVGTVFGIVRQDAEKQVKADEQKLYSLRDQMRNSCKTLGALFDDRSLDCVFTANFFSGEDHSKPTASKKLYAGSIFDCTPDWFGIDVTTFKENAYRLTRAQSAASSAMMGSGLGTALGAVTSGAIDRAIDSKKAKDALEEACEENGQVLKDGKCVDKEESSTPKQTDSKKVEKAKQKEEKKNTSTSKTNTNTSTSTSTNTSTNTSSNNTKGGFGAPATNGFGESTRSGFDNASLGVDTSLGSKSNTSSGTSKTSLGQSNSGSSLKPSSSSSSGKNGFGETKTSGFGSNSSGGFGGGLSSNSSSSDKK